MAFINKKEEVIKLRLTQHGKNLLSRGKFIPECYAFFDDDIVYDVRYGGFSEHQNDAQTRIRDNARRDAQHVAVSLAKKNDIETEEILAEEIPEFESLVYSISEGENGKVLGYPISNMSLGTQELPRFELNVFESEIENSQILKYENLDSARQKIPQLEFSPEHVLIHDTMAVDPLASEGELVDNESFEINPIADKIEFMDGSFLEHVPESVVILLEEFNVPYLAKNFEIEVFEIVEENTNKTLVPVKNWQSLFEIEIDEAVPSVPNKNKQRNNFF